MSATQILVYVGLYLAIVIAAGSLVGHLLRWPPRRNRKKWCARHRARNKWPQNPLQ